MSVAASGMYAGKGEGLQLTIGVSRTVDVTIMTELGFVFNVGGVNGDTAGFLLWGLVDGRVVGELGSSVCGKDLGDSSSQRRLSVIDVA